MLPRNICMRHIAGWLLFFEDWLFDKVFVKNLNHCLYWELAILLSFNYQVWKICRDFDHFVNSKVIVWERLALVKNEIINFLFNLIWVLVLINLSSKTFNSFDEVNKFEKFVDVFWNCRVDHFDWRSKIGDYWREFVNVIFLLLDFVNSFWRFF